MLFILFQILLILLAVVILIWTVYYYYYFGKCKQIRGPMPLPILGNVLQFNDPSKLVQSLDEITKQYGKIVKLSLGFVFILAISDLDFTRFILSSKTLTKKASFYKFLLPSIRTGLITSEGKKWKSRRKLLEPTFGQHILKNYVEIFESNTDILIDKLRSEVNKTSFNIHECLELCSLDIVAATAMGTTLNTQQNLNVTYRKAFKEIVDCILTRMQTPLQYLDCLFWFTENYRKHESVLKYLDNFIRGIIRTREEKLLKQQSEKEFQHFDKSKSTFLDLLLLTKIQQQTLCEDDILEEVNTFAASGHDTIASAASFTIYCLAKHPEIQNKILEEQNLLLRYKKGEKLTIDDLTNMTYLEMVIKEAMRLYCTVPVIGREALEDFYYNGQLIRKGTQLILFFYGLQNDADYYTDPDEFRPERFAEDNEFENSIFNTVAFSSGPRICMGKRFAMLELKTIISKLIRSYEVLPSDESHKPCLKCDISLNSTNGLLVKFKYRKE